GTRSARTCCSRCVKSGSSSRRYTVRGVSPHWRAAWSTVAPQANASKSVSTAFLRCWAAIISPRRFRPVSEFVRTLSGCSPFGFVTRELLVALDDHVAVQRVQLHQEGPPAALLGGDQRRAAAAEEVQRVLALARGVFH